MVDLNKFDNHHWKVDPDFIYDLVFIGCGTANTFALLHLIKQGYKGNIAVIEKGKDIYNRNRKEVMNGFLGAGLYSDAKIILSTTTGGNIKDYISEPDLNLLDYTFTDLIKEYYGKELNIIEPEKEDLTKYSPFKVLVNKTLHLGSEYGEELGKKIYDYLKACSNIKFIFEADVISLYKRPTKEFYSVIYSTKVGNPNSVYSNKVIIGTGKSGIKLLNNIISHYKLPTTESKLSVGVRVEVPFEITKELTNKYYDFKFLLQNKDITTRSFCVSPKGIVIEENTYDMITYNGGSFKEESAKTNKTNFGIMCEMNAPKEWDSAFLFQTNVVKRANELNKIYTKNIPYYDWFHNSGIYMNIFTPYVYRSITKWMGQFDTISKGFLKNVSINVPEVKYVSQKLKLTDKLEINGLPNVFVVGDVAGISRGIYQAVLSGLYISNQFLK